MNNPLIMRARTVACVHLTDDPRGSVAQLMLDLANYAAQLEGTLAQKQLVIDRMSGALAEACEDSIDLSDEVKRLHGALTDQEAKYKRLYRSKTKQRKMYEMLLAENRTVTKRLRGRLSELDPRTQSVPRPNDSIRARLLTPDQDAELTADLAAIAKTRMVNYDGSRVTSIWPSPEEMVSMYGDEMI